MIIVAERQTELIGKGHIQNAKYILPKEQGNNRAMMPKEKASSLTMCNFHHRFRTVSIEIYQQTRRTLFVRCPHMISSSPPYYPNSAWHYRNLLRIYLAGGFTLAAISLLICRTYGHTSGRPRVHCIVQTSAYAHHIPFYNFTL